MSIYPPLKFWERESDRETDPVRYEELLKKEEQEDMLVELETLRALKITPRSEALKMIPTNAITLDKDPGYSARRKKESARKKKEPASRKKKLIPSNATYRNADPDYCDGADRNKEEIARRKNTVQNVPEKITFWWAPPQRGYHKLNVKGSKRGGYGAILRDDDGNPIAAVAGVSEPVSTLFHELQGVEQGLLVASKHINYRCSIVRIEVSQVYPAQVVGGYQSLYEKDDIPMVHDIINRIRILMSEISFCVIDSCPKGTNNAAACLSELLPTDEFKTVEYDVKKLPEELDVIVKEEAARPSPWK